MSSEQEWIRLHVAFCILASLVDFQAAAKMASKEALKCLIFLGTVRENNFGSRAAKFIERKLTEKGFQVTLIGKASRLKFGSIPT